MANNQSEHSNTNPRTARVLMFDVSLPMAESLYDWSNVLLLVGALAVAVGTFGNIRMGAVKELFANERISANEAETARALESAALATERANSAELQLEKLRRQIGPRVIDREKFLAALEGVPPPDDMRLSYSDVPDGYLVVVQLTELLREAGWPEPIPMKLGADETFAHAVPVGPDTPSAGVFVLFPRGGGMDDPTIKAMVDAITESMGAVSGGTDERVDPGNIWLVVVARH